MDQDGSYFFFFLGGEGQSVMPGRPAWWITSELHTLISSLLYQSLGVNCAPAFKLPDCDAAPLCNSVEQRLTEHLNEWCERTINQNTGAHRDTIALAKFTLEKRGLITLI